MTTIPFGQLIAEAEAEGFSNELLPINEYDCEVAGTTAGTSQGGKPQIGVRFKVLVGPYAGKSFWDNLTLTADNPKAVAVFLRKMGQLGVSTDFIKTQTSVEVLAGAIQVGKQYKVTHGHREFNGKTYADVKKVTPLDVAIAAAPAVAAAPVAAPVAAPAPVAVAAAPAPVAPAPAAVAPAAVAVPEPAAVVAAPVAAVAAPAVVAPPAVAF